MGKEDKVRKHGGKKDAKMISNDKSSSLRSSFQRLMEMRLVVETRGDKRGGTTNCFKRGVAKEDLNVERRSKG